MQAGTSVAGSSADQPDVVGDPELLGPVPQRLDLLLLTAHHHQHGVRVGAGDVGHRLQQELHALVGLEGARVEDDLGTLRGPAAPDGRGHLGVRDRPRARC